MQITIRVAEIQDAKKLSELSIKTFRDAFGADNTKEDMDQYVAAELNVEKIRATMGGENIFFLAYADETLAGYAKMRTVEYPLELNGIDHIEIERIYVHCDFQSKKVGAALMAHCLNHAKSKGRSCVWLGVWERNTVAVNFYKRWGFEFFGSHPFLLGSDLQTDVLMKKMI